MITGALDFVRGSWRYAAGLRGFLSETLTLEEAKAVASLQLQKREENFLTLLEQGIYGHPSSPYYRLLSHAGLTFDAVRTMVDDQGLEGALSSLHEAGVYVTLDEFKGRMPVRRPGLEFSVTADDFENPLSTSHFTVSTGASRSPGMRSGYDFDLVAQDAASLILSLEAVGAADRPIFVWRAAPPSAYGLLLFLRFVRLGRMPAAWFAPNQPGWGKQGLMGRALLAYTLLASRLSGKPIPRPEYMPDANAIIDRLAEAARLSEPAVVYCIQSQAVQICLAAERASADISGTVFFCSGEPFTDGKAAVLSRVGARGTPQYGMGEVGTVCLPCGSASAPDDMHLMSDKLAVLGHRKQLAPDIEVNALSYTSLLPSAPKVMLNVESGDYAVVEERDCGCLWQALGFATHFHHVRSYEKLTSHGVMFMGSMLFELLEDTLPARFGGNPTDYQLVEVEDNGITRVSLLISPRLGPVDEGAVLEAFFDKVGFASWSRRMVDTWRKSGTLRVERREPIATAVGKILPLHILGPQPVQAATQRESP